MASSPGPQLLDRFAIRSLPQSQTAVCIPDNFGSSGNFSLNLSLHRVYPQSRLGGPPSSVRKYFARRALLQKQQALLRNRTHRSRCPLLFRFALHSRSRRNRTRTRAAWRGYVLVRGSVSRFGKASPCSVALLVQNPVPDLFRKPESISRIGSLFPFRPNDLRLSDMRVLCGH